ncbi:MAG: hypothetical protein ABSC50_01955 [Candidatus Bathyarchaeia archaeon]
MSFLTMICASRHVTAHTFLEIHNEKCDFWHLIVGDFFNDELRTERVRF